MTRIRRYLNRALGVGAAQHETVVVATPQEALLASREIAAELASLSSDERLAALADLHALNDALERRLPQLERELDDLRAKLWGVRQSLRACNRYAASADLNVPARARRRS